MIRSSALSLTLLMLIGGARCAKAQDLPVEAAETIEGKRVEFPTALHGTVATCVFGFGRESADKVDIWLESLSSDSVNAWSIVNLETVPAVARGTIRMTMRRGIPPPLRDRSLIINKNSKEWKKILEIQQDNLPVVVLFSADGKIVWKRSGTFSAGIANELKAQIAKLSEH